MIRKIQDTILKHLKNNVYTYILLMMAFTIGISAGAFTVNTLAEVQREELTNYFTGFLQLFGKQEVDGNILFHQALVNHLKIVFALWILGVTVVGIPFIFIIIGIRGFITGFSTGFIFYTLGVKGIAFTLITVFPKEILIIPFLMAMGVSGINFSMSIIRSRSKKNHTKEKIRTNLAAYCAVTLLLSAATLAGILTESYVSPVLMKLLIPIFVVR